MLEQCPRCQQWYDPESPEHREAEAAAGWRINFCLDCYYIVDKGGGIQGAIYEARKRQSEETAAYRHGGRTRGRPRGR